MKVVKVKAPAGTTLAENKDEAQRFRDKTIMPALKKGEKVAIDFSDVDSATQSYIHVLVADAVRTYGDAVFSQIEFVGPSEGIVSLIETVYEYTILAGQALESAAPIGDVD